MASTAGSLHFLTQFISFHGPHFLFVISSILSSKKVYLDFLTVLLKFFQFSRLCICQYLFSVWQQYLFHQALECLVMLTIFKYLNHMSSILITKYQTTSSKNSASWMDVVFKFLMTWMRSSMNQFSSSLPLISNRHLVKMFSSLMGMSIVIGVWLEKSLYSRWIWWGLNSQKEGQRNTRSKTEFEFWLLSKNLVGKFSVGLEMARENESAILKRMSLWIEWKGKFKSHRLSLMLKSSVIMIMLWILVSVFLRYFKADWDKSE